MSISPKSFEGFLAEFSSKVDLLICGSSFESRCLSVSRRLDVSLVEQVIIIRNDTYSEQIESYHRELSSLWGSKVRELVVSSDDPVVSFENMFKAFPLERDRPLRVLIDITTLTHETLMMLYRVSSLCFNRDDVVDFIYSTADEYSLGAPKPLKWLSKGTKEIRSVIGYPGRLVPSKRNHLIILVGFEEYRALAVIREFEPSLLSIGYGDKSEASTGPHQETNETKVRRLRSLVGQVDEFEFSCYDPLLAEARLAELVNANPDYNHIIAPMNTKPSALGAARYASKNDYVQLCYAQPMYYNFDNYSRPGTHYYCFRFSDLVVEKRQ